MDNQMPLRKRNRLLNFDYSSPNGYFVTFCVQNMQCLLWEREYDEWNHTLSSWGRIVEEAILSVNNYGGIQLDQYVVMPNHVHMIVILTDTGESSISLSNVVRYIKSKVTKAIGRSIWQKSFYDHVIRNQDDYIHIQDYIVSNPGKWKEDRYYM